MKPIAYSIYNIILAAKQETLRGIERIDLGYISHLFETWPAECYGIFPTALGLRLFSREQVLAGRDMLMEMWKENTELGVDPVFEWLKRVYAAETQSEPAISVDRRASDWQGYRRVAQLLLCNGINFGKPMSTLPQNSIYIDVGHNALATPIMHNWLKRRPDVKPVFMLHDAIPLELPELVMQRNVRIHRKILATTATHAKAVIVPTVSAGRSVRAELERLGTSSIPIHAVNLPINDAFQVSHRANLDVSTHPYFLVCGAIEARKNPSLLLNVWRNLVNKLGERAPRLIFAGSTGYSAADALDQIRRSRILRNHVFMASSLSTVAMANLMAGARAVLMPSFAEGFGLPTVEALGLGTPTVLSDIPAHRDAVGEFGLFIDATDGPNWQRQIEKLIHDTDDYVALKQRVSTFQPKRWSTYMAEIKDVLSGI